MILKNPNFILAFLAFFNKFIPIIHSFNVDTTSPWKIQRNQSTVNFGYSIALSASGQIYIGSPLSDAGRGSVYKCLYLPSRKCEEILLNEKVGDYKTFRLGSSIDISSQGKVAVSAPGTYLDIYYKLRKDQNSQPITKTNRLNTGLVYTFDSDDNDQQNESSAQIITQPDYIEACKREDLSGTCSKNAEGCGRSHCVAGTSINFLYDDSAVISLPGAHYSQGTVERYKNEDLASPSYNLVGNKGFEYRFYKPPNSFSTVEARQNNARIGNSNYRYFMSQTMPDYFKRSEQDEDLIKKSNSYQNTYDSNLLGLSMAVIDQSYIAAGAPGRYQFSQKGAVIIRKIGDVYDDDNQFLGDTVGERFGYTIISQDFNGDGMDDLLIGAPTYTSVEETNNGAITKNACDDCGRVYYYRQVDADQTGPHAPEKQWVRQQIIESPEELPNGRFGFSMGPLGNIDTLEGDEIVVGLPTADENRGAIAILSYSPSNDNFTITQTIKGRDVYDNNNNNDQQNDEIDTSTQYFGLSVMDHQQKDSSGAMSLVNIDRKNQGDVIVGSRNEVAVLFTRKVISMAEGYPIIEFPIDQIDLEPGSMNCKREISDSGANNAICYQVTFKIDLGKNNGNSSPNTLVNMNVTLDSSFDSVGSRRLKFDADSFAGNRDIQKITDSQVTIQFRQNQITIGTYVFGFCTKIRMKILEVYCENGLFDTLDSTTLSPR